CQHYKSAPYSF
nr:immunoglobulin light chain junction region [Macaca mulatta]MOV37591.1 immunoglobulin light chain junction region [Macaca mulatta]